MHRLKIPRRLDWLATVANRHFKADSLPLEMFNGVWDIWWASWVLLFGAFALPNLEYQALGQIFEEEWHLAVPMMLLGVLQLMTAASPYRWARAHMALFSAVLWAGLLMIVIDHSGQVVGPHTVNYGMAILGEAWVFLRLSRPWQ